MNYFSNAFKLRIAKPSDSTPALGVLVDAANPRSIVGIAFPTSHIGGVSLNGDPTSDYLPPEQVFRLEINRAWVEGKALKLDEKNVLEGRFVLRDGRFVELAEEAE